VDDLEESNEVDDFISCQNIPLKRFSKGKEVEKGSSPNGKLSSLKENMGEGKGRKNICKNKSMDSTDSVSTLYSSDE
jgi:hypothetical protein